jgi:hypothetical protein
MGNVQISASEALTVIAGAVGLVTAIWHAAMYVGKLTVKVDRHEDRLNDHEERIDRMAGSSIR